ncbi:hypothetical protein HN51_007947 [Arachis hypogaea]|uniref:Uncharacterized protein LOC107489518 isoform X1 n=2 Tax=Arachis TaxID=3817 RepID=A0A6P4DC64_ARADU|nr:uncharacterized protein LOC107489518 isoform X1 [Arachis duranensis]XP_025700209.1 uncharacterized protein LOC112801602 isoform X1 [Arachis hypogaea]XP_052118259.1 uncharacterized protein LOC107489518 isoform X1 [Arachis duranensis]QHO42189.1 uncharacterized protein DS421_5g152090 [Arachis hypogaea]RYR58529.1 hypothetical protein Ahy_A05g024340 [Arachis hypogaea]
MLSKLATSSLASFSPCFQFNAKNLNLSRTKPLFFKHLRRRATVSIPFHFGSLSERTLPSVCFSNPRDESETKLQDKESGSNKWPILQRWQVPWQWQTLALTSLSCGLGFVFTGLVEAAAVINLGIQYDELSLDEKSEISFAEQGLITAVVLGIIYRMANSYQPLSEDFFKYDWGVPFDLQKGWLLWAGIGLAGALTAMAMTGAVMSFFSGETPEMEIDSLVTLLPSIGSLNITFSTACVVGTTGVLAPLLEETVFRGFIMASLTKWVPTPVAIIISAAVFALAHFTPEAFPQLFVLGTFMGISYAQTRNLLAPITIHAFWNTGVALLLSSLQLQGQ